jgi:hypothetical protein
VTLFAPTPLPRCSLFITCYITCPCITPLPAVLSAFKGLGSSLTTSSPPCHLIGGKRKCALARVTPVAAASVSAFEFQNLTYRHSWNGIAVLAAR